MPLANDLGEACSTQSLEIGQGFPAPRGDVPVRLLQSRLCVVNQPPCQSTPTGKGVLQ